MEVSNKIHKNKDKINVKHDTINAKFKQIVLFSDGIKSKIKTPTRGVIHTKSRRLSKKIEGKIILNLSLGRFEQPTLRLSNCNRNLKK